MQQTAQSRAPCASCGTTASTVGTCPHCGVAQFCQQCIGSEADNYRRHVENITFSITAPPQGPGLRNAAERLASDWAGDGLGAVHQWVLYVAAAQGEGQYLRTAISDDDLRRLGAGNIWPDFPVADERDGDAYLKLLRTIPLSDAPYIQDEVFRLQPSQEMRFALAFDYKNLPRLLMPLFGVSEEACELASRMLELRVRPTEYHFMRNDSAEPDRAVAGKALSAHRRWYRSALEPVSEGSGGVNYFLIGHIAHGWADSYSAAHTLRGKAGPGAEPAYADPLIQTPYEFRGTQTAAATRDTHILKVYYFGDQTDATHGRLESWRAVSEPGSEPHRRAMAAAAMIRELLFMVQRHKNALAARPPSMTLEQAVGEFEQLMVTRVLA
jgi:hypothetical protein